MTSQIEVKPLYSQIVSHNDSNIPIDSYLCLNDFDKKVTNLTQQVAEKKNIIKLKKDNKSKKFAENKIKIEETKESIKAIDNEIEKNKKIIKDIITCLEKNHKKLMKISKDQEEITKINTKESKETKDKKTDK